MNLPWRRAILVAIFTATCSQSQQARSYENPIPATRAILRGAGERHAAIHRAIRALEAAKTYIESASHDFCGRRVAALAESNLALNELGLSVICEKRRDKSTSRGVLQSIQSSWDRSENYGAGVSVGPEHETLRMFSSFQVNVGGAILESSVPLSPDRHPLIRQAIDALEAARRDLQTESQAYCGHRTLAFEAVNRALAQLKLVLDCDEDQSSSV